MKLIFCPDCWDVFKLTTGKVRKCECGKCAGMYTSDGHYAVVNGEGISLAFNNNSLALEISKFLLIKDKRPVTQLDTEGLEFTAWVRDHEGPSNPRTKIDKNLGKPAQVSDLAWDKAFESLEAAFGPSD